MSWYRMVWTWAPDVDVVLRRDTVQYLRADVAKDAGEGLLEPCEPPGPQLYKIGADWANGTIRARAGQVLELDAETAHQINQDVVFGAVALGGAELQETEQLLRGVGQHLGNTVVGLVPESDPAAVNRGQGGPYEVMHRGNQFGGV